VGGVATFYQALQPHLADRVELFTIGTRSGNEGVFGTVRRSIIDYVRFWRRLRAGGHEVVHLNPSFAPKALLRDAVFLAIAKVLRRKRLVFFHGWHKATEDVIRKYAPWAFRLTYAHADAFIVLSSEYESALRDFGISKPIIVATTAVSDDLLLAARSGKRSSRECISILFLARVEKNKGIYDTIHAFECLRERHSDLSLIVAGDGPELRAIQIYVGQNKIPRVKFLGYVSGIAKHEALSNADIYCLPSYSEGLPVSMLEAMAYGLPVVVRPVGGIRDFFQNGRMGLLIEDLSTTAVINALETLISDEQLRIATGSFNRDYAEGHFGAGLVAATLKQMYDALLLE
jgi:glycosyltransferase involved in cell wall biosynthesis